MVEPVDEILDLHKRLAGARSDAGRTRLERAVKAAALACDLYGLTAKEIKAVGGRSKK